MSPFQLQRMPLFADDRPSGVVGLPRGDGPGVLQPAAGLALVLAGGAVMAVLAVPAFVCALRAARAYPDLRAVMAAAEAAQAAEAELGRP
jgi:hypothetical protein